MAEIEGAQPNGEDTGPQVGLIAQYTKDFSFENPSAPAIFQSSIQPRIDVQFNIGATQVGEDLHEVVLHVTARADIESQTAFVIELAYAGLFGIRNVPDDQLQPFLLAEAPRLLFPFARRVIADATRDGNFPPLLLEPLDFSAMFMAQQQQAEALAQGEPAGQA